MPLIQTISRVYAHALSNKPIEFFNYEYFEPVTDNDENYSITQKLGRGKYSEVFEAIHAPSKKTVVLKILKPVRKKKIKREIKILEVLCSVPQFNCHSISTPLSLWLQGLLID